jgi:hypothetical protein
MRSLRVACARLAASSAVCAALWSCASPESDATPSSGQYVGELEGGQVKLGIVLRDETVQVYVCGHGATLLSHTRWFKGSADGDAFVLEADGWQLRGGRVELGFRGQLISPDRERSQFTTEPVQEGSDDGVYAAAGSGCRAGAIVWPHAGAKGCGVQGSQCNEQGERAQVTPISCPVDGRMEVSAVFDGVEQRTLFTRVESE